LYRVGDVLTITGADIGATTDAKITLMYADFTGAVSANINPAFVHSLHSNVIHVSNSTFRGNVGQIDCETNGAGGYGSLACLNKGDKIFLLNLGSRNTDDTACQSSPTYNNIAGVIPSDALNTDAYDLNTKDSCFYDATSESFASNPKYPNMYTINKIGKIPKNNVDEEYELITDGSIRKGIDDQGYRHEIHLDMGVNGMYISNTETDTTGATNWDTSATIYKFYPPSLATTGCRGYEYVAPCANRGICDSESGTCDCFTGYTGDNCATMENYSS